MKLEFSLVGTLLCLLRVVESSSNSYYDKDSFYQVPYFVHSPFNIANPILKYFYRYNPDTALRNRQVVPALYSSQRVTDRDNFFRGHVEARPGSFHEAIPYNVVEGLKRTESDRVPLRDAVEHIPIEGEMNILVRSGGSDSLSDDSGDGPFSRGSVEAFPSPVTPYSASYDDTEVNAVVSQVDVLRDHYPRIGFRGNVEAPPSTPNENPLFKYYRVPERNSVSSIDDRWTQYVSGEHRPLTKSSYPWRRPTVTRQSESESYKVVCYVESWAVYRPKPMDFDIKDIDPFACTHLIYSFAGLDEKDYTITSLDEKRDIVQGAYKATIALKESNPELKVMIALGGWAEGGLKYSQMVSTPERRRAFMDSLMVFMDKHGFDGLDLDWEYPGATDRGGVLTDKENVAILCESIKERFTTKGLILTMAVPIAKVRIDDGYDIPRLSKCLDFFNLMSYDLRGPWDGVVDHHSPIAQRTTDKYIHRGLNLRDGIQLFVNEGAPKHKIVVGVPLYGRSFTLETPEKATPGSLSISMGNEGPYTKEKGYIAFYEVCILQRNGGWQVTRDEAGGPYMYKDNQWIGYDNEKYVEEKVNFAKREKLGGVMMWAIDLDDYLGMCGKRWPLMSTIRRTLNSPSSGLGEPEILSPVPEPEPEPEPSAPEKEQEKPVRETTPETASNIIFPMQIAQISETHSASAPTGPAPAPSGPAPGSPCGSGSKIFARSPSSCRAFLICNQGSYEEKHCSEGLQWNHVKDICDWPDNVKCKAGDLPQQAPPVNVPVGPSGPPGGPPDAPVVDLPVDTSGPVTELEYVGPSSTKLSGDFMVVCYFTNWAVYRPGIGKYVPEDIDETTCTHVVYGFAVLDYSNLVIKSHDPYADVDMKFYERVTALKSKGIKVTLAIGGWNDSQGDKYSRLVNSPTARQRFITHVVEFIKKYNFDGLDLDWEYPVCWQVECDKGPPSDKEGFASWVKELSSAFKPHGLLLSTAVSPSKKVIDLGYDVPSLSRYFDWIAVMTYDFHGHWDGKTGHVAPMSYHPDDDYDYFNADFAIRYWIEKGADRKKIVMGMPMYGQAFTLNDPSNHGLNSPATKGTAGQFTRAAGFLSYYEICNFIKQQSWTVVQDPEHRMGPYAYKGNQWVSFDDVNTIRRKSQYIRDMGLGGGMIWALDLDDFTNRCGQGRYPLLTTIKNILGPALDPSKPVPPPSKPVDHPPQPDPEPQSPGNQPPPKPVPDPQTIPKPVQVLKPVPDPVDGYKVVCYYTNWAWYRQGEGKYLPEDVDPSLCTHINYAFAVLDQNTLLMKPHDSWADLDNNFYFRVSDLKKYGSKVLIALGGWNDSSGGKYSKLVNDPAARQRFNNHVLGFIQKYNFDGLDLDWEYPKCWQVNCNLGPDSDKDGFSAWIMELSALFKPLGLLLTAAVSPSYKVIDAGYDVPVLSKYLDIINVMNYDYHGQWDKITGHVAPMYPHPDDLEPKFNTDFTIKYWIQLGADPKKLALGMPMYGQSFTLTSASSNGLNVPTYGGGEAGPYTRARGFLAYYEICYFIRNQDWTVIRDPLDTMGPYAYKGQTWVGFDDIPQIEFKSNYIKKMGLGGAMIWALDLDDFRNRCGCEAYPLLKTINRVLRNYPPAANSCPLLGEGSSSPISGNAESSLETTPWHTPPTITSKPPKVQNHEPAIDEGSPPIHEPEGPPKKEVEDIAQGAQPIFPPGFDERPPPVVGGDCEAGQFVSHTDCGKFYECYKGKLQEKSCPKGSHWDGKRACRRPSDANCRTRVVHPPTRVVESPPTRVVDGSPPTRVDGGHPTSVVKHPSLSPHDHARPAPVSDTKKETGDLGAAGQPCDAGQFKRHMQCAKFYECVQGYLLERTCVPGLHWDGHGRCNWPNKANCKTLDAHDQPPPPTPVATTTRPRPPSTKKPSTWWSHTTEATTKHYTPGDVQAHPPAPTTFEPPKTPTWWWTQSTEATTPSWTHPPGSLDVDGYKVVCYFTNWAWYRQGIAKYKPEDIDPNLCTHIIYGFAVLNPNTLLIKSHDAWADIDNKFYQKVTSQKQHGTKVLVAIGGWNDSKGGKYSQLVNDPAARKRFIENVVEFIKKYNFDGLDLDWEYPKCWQVDCSLGPDSDKAGFTAWIRELREAFTPYNWLLTAAVSPSYKVMDAGYDIPALSRYLDFINVMTYDYHGHWDKMTGHVAPMFHHPDSPAPQFNANYTIHYWIEQGADRKKLIMGMPLYGQAFTITDTKNTGLNSKGSKGQAGEYTRAAGFLAYYEICDRVLNKGYTLVRDPSGTIGPYAFGGNQWMGFDDVTMIRFKSNYIKQMGLGGGMVWALDLDDFNNRCNCEPHPLLRTIRRELRNDYPVAATRDCSLS